MSDADTADAGREEIWLEQYRPEQFSDIVGQESIVERLESYVTRNDIPNMLFAGPAGVGKCVTGETPVLTSEGLTEIGNVVGDHDGFRRHDEETRVLSYTEEGQFEYRKPSHRFAKQADDLLRVQTRDGNKFTVTPEHKLLVLTHDGLEWKTAESLDTGERVVRPLTAPLPDTDCSLNWMAEMDGERTFVHVSEEFSQEYDIPFEENLVGMKKQAVRGLRNGSSVQEVAAETGIKKGTIAAAKREFSDTDLDTPSPICSLGFLRQLDVPNAELASHIKQIQHVSVNNRRSEPITPPSTVTPELARWIGLAISEARIENGRIKFYNTDNELLDSFEALSEQLFDITPQTETQKGVPYVELTGRTLTEYLSACFDVFPLSDGNEIGSALLRSDGQSRHAFLRAVFDAEGHVTEEGIIELTQKDGDLITLLSYLLAGFGIPSRRKQNQKRATNGSETARTYHSLYISSADHLERFQSEVGFGIDEKSHRLAENAKRDGNPNDDTVPTQEAVTALCAQLNLNKSEYVPDSLNPDSPGRKRYQQCLSELLDDANARLEAVQQARERLTQHSSAIDSLTTVPVKWERSREELEPLETRREVATVTAAREDYLLEYARGDRVPYADRVQSILQKLSEDELEIPIAQVQRELDTIIETLDISYASLVEEADLRSPEVGNLLNQDDHEIGSLCRFRTVAEQLDTVLSRMASIETLGYMQTLQRVASTELYFDEVEDIHQVEDQRRVYDLTVPGVHNYVAGAVPAVMHNTTSAVTIAKELYGEDWQEHFLELNASDERGIDVVRDRIKSFARTSFGGVNYRIIFLDEADALCVPPGTEVVTGYPSSPELKKIEDVAEEGEPIPSVGFETNTVQSDKGKLIDSGIADFFELELEDGRCIEASLTHPFFVVGKNGKLVEKELQELSPGDEIADFKDDIGVSRCEICGDWTTGRFCSVDCKNEGHSREMQGEDNPMYGTSWSDERREKIVSKLSDGQFKGENNPNYGGDFHGVSVWEMDEETIEQFCQNISEKRSGTTWEEWVVDADPEAVKEQIGQTYSEWWDSLDAKKKEKIVEKATENCDYPVYDITGDNNPMRDPEVAQKVSEALKGHEPTGGNIRHSDELGHLVRSDWEYEVAKALQDAGVDYEYEPEFELSDSVFHPDFLIDDTVIEVKGVAKLWGQTEKVEEFLEVYGDDYRFIVVGDGELPHHEHYNRDEFEPEIVSDGGLQTVETAEVTSIEYSHRGKAYNISMEDTPNFMLANGILTHNTSDAQSALRRTMEQFSNNVRFILSCNYSSQIIDPIQSRCTVFRFSPLSDEAIETQVQRIAEDQGIELTDDGTEALIYVAGGDMRAAINGLQAAAVTGAVVDEEAVFEITSTARPEDIEEMVTLALDGDFTASRSQLDRLLTEEGIAGGDVIDQLHRSVWEFGLGDEAAVRVLDRIGEADYRITEGANERIQLEALLASLALED